MPRGFAADTRQRNSLCSWSSYRTPRGTPHSSRAPGERHAHLAEHVGEIAVYCWLGKPDQGADYTGVDWILGIDWVPYQRDTFVTPPFAGYVSGHSTFSRSAAEVMALFTISEYSGL